MVEYLGEIETKFENTLAFISGARWIRIMKKMEVEKLVRHSFNQYVWVFSAHFCPFSITISSNKDLKLILLQMS